MSVKQQGHSEQPLQPHQAGERWPPDDPRWRTVMRWLWIALPEDCRQCVHLADVVCGPEARPATMFATVHYLLRELRREVWDRCLSLPTKPPRTLRPSSLTRRMERARANGRKNAARKLTPEWRSWRATQGWLARARKEEERQ
jgi:hypothetical protein